MLGIVQAAVIVIVGWIVGSLVGLVAKSILDFIKLEQFLKVHKLQDALGSVQVSKVLVQLVKYYIILVFVQLAVFGLALGPLSDFLAKVIDFAPKVIGGMLIVVFAAILGELAKEKVLEVHEKESYMRLIGTGAKYVVVFMGLIVGLDTIGFPTSIVNSTFITIVQALGLGFALAFGLAFGFGGQDTAKEWVKEWKKRLHV
ncbi:MAG: hypothetical protein WCT31_05275 [Candidatus Micrarchaeia archaeon]